tara:strand:+ start:2344 stop:3057 length:714 start_codon:yes stop_codon:yes gene_type:complete
MFTLQTCLSIIRSAACSGKWDEAYSAYAECLSAFGHAECIEIENYLFEHHPPLFSTIPDDLIDKMFAFNASLEQVVDAIRIADAYACHWFGVDGDSPWGEKLKSVYVSGKFFERMDSHSFFGGLWSFNYFPGDPDSSLIIPPFDHPEFLKCEGKCTCFAARVDAYDYYYDPNDDSYRPTPDACPGSLTMMSYLDQCSRHMTLCPIDENGETKINRWRDHIDTRFGTVGRFMDFDLEA